MEYDNMYFYYQAFGFYIKSSIALPALISVVPEPQHDFILVEIGKVNHVFHSEILFQSSVVTFSNTEFVYQLPNIAKYKVTAANHVLIEPISSNWPEILLYFYANCLAAILFQRNQIPFHVSGVCIPDSQDVILFAGKSGAGKSSTALKMQEKGFLPFTDDTAVLCIEGDAVYAQASYPMARLWEPTIAKQTIFEEKNKAIIFDQINKYAFSFHDHFSTEKKRVLAIYFLDEMGENMHVRQMESVESFQLLHENIYRREWFLKMNKQIITFETISGIVNNTALYQASRPTGEDTFDSFSEEIKAHIFKSFALT
jgi:hypothetical protein